jgi:hypothetical protein
VRTAKRRRKHYLQAADAHFQAATITKCTISANVNNKTPVAVEGIKTNSEAQNPA